MKAIITMTNGKRIQRKGNYSRIIKLCSPLGVKWVGYEHVEDSGSALWEVLEKNVKRITIVTT